MGSNLADRLTGGKQENRHQNEGPSFSEDRARQERLWAAVEKNDGAELERLRDVIRSTDVAPLAAGWRATLPWPKKEALICWLTDQTAKRHPELEPLLRDGLSAPTFEVRVYSYCSLTADFESFSLLLEGGDAVLKAKVEELRV